MCAQDLKLSPFADKDDLKTTGLHLEIRTQFENIPCLTLKTAHVNSGETAIQIKKGGKTISKNGLITNVISFTRLHRNNRITGPMRQQSWKRCEMANFPQIKTVFAFWACM